MIEEAIIHFEYDGERKEERDYFDNPSCHMNDFSSVIDLDIHETMKNKFEEKLDETNIFSLNDEQMNFLFDPINLNDKPKLRQEGESRLMELEKQETLSVERSSHKEVETEQGSLKNISRKILKRRMNP